MLVSLALATGLNQDYVTIVWLVILQSILKNVEKGWLILLPVWDHVGILVEFEFLDQVNVHFTLEDEVFEWPDHIPNGGDHVFVWVRVDL
jgi:hypothetical protein